MHRCCARPTSSAACSIARHKPLGTTPTSPQADREQPKHRRKPRRRGLWRGPGKRPPHPPSSRRSAAGAPLGAVATAVVAKGALHVPLMQVAVGGGPPRAPHPAPRPPHCAGHSLRRPRGRGPSPTPFRMVRDAGPQPWPPNRHDHPPTGAGPTGAAASRRQGAAWWQRRPPSRCNDSPAHPLPPSPPCRHALPTSRARGGLRRHVLGSTRGQRQACSCTQRRSTHRGRRRR